MATVLDLNADWTERLRQVAVRKEQTPDQIIRAALEQYIERQEAQRGFVEEAEASWEHYQRTGLHVTGDEFFEWLGRLGTEAETDFPECHT